MLKRIKKYWGRDSKVIHPPVDTDRFFPKKFRDKIFYFDLEIQIQKSKDLINLIFERLNTKKIQS